MTWAAPYIGQLIDPKTPFPCLAFARRFQREAFGRELPGWVSIARAITHGEDLDASYPEIAKPVDGCLVLMGDRKVEARHVGVWCEAAKLVVHADDAFGSVIASHLWMLRLAWQSVRFYAVPQ